MVEQQPEQAGDVKRISRFVAIVGVFLLLLSQFLVFSQPTMEDVLLPPYLGYAIVGVIVMILSQLIPANAFWVKLSTRPIFRDRVFWVFVAVLLAIVTVIALNAFMVFRRLNFIPLVTIWLLGGACYVYAFINPSFDLTKIREWLKTHRNEIFMVLFIMVISALPRLYKLGQIPRVLDGDEGSVGLFAQATVDGVLINPFALWENFGALYLQLINISMRFFGTDAFGLRLLPALGGILAVPAVYLFARWVGGKRIAAISAVMIAISHSHLHFSRISSVAYIQDAWLIPLELYFLISGLEKRQSWRTALSGVLLAIHYSVYLTSQIITGLVLIYMLILFIFYRSWFIQRLSQAFAFWGGFFLSILPSGLYAYYNPNEFMNRLGSSGTFQTGYVENVMLATGQSAFEVLLGRVVHAFLSLFYYPAADFYGSPSPMMSMISGVMLIAGLGIILWQIRNPAYLLLNGYIWGSAVAIGVFATPPSADSYRMLMALPAAVTIAAIGIDKILEIIGLSWANARQAYTFTITALLTSLLFFNLWTYYAEFAGQCRFAADLAGRFATYLGVQLQEIDNENRVYMLSDDYYFHGSHPSTLFLSLRPVINFNDPADTLDAVTGETIIAPPSRIEELEAWARTHPGGILHYEYDCTTTILLSYQVP